MLYLYIYVFLNILNRYLYALRGNGHKFQWERGSAEGIRGRKCKGVKVLLYFNIFCCCLKESQLSLRYKIFAVYFFYYLKQ